MSSAQQGRLGALHELLAAAILEEEAEGARVRGDEMARAEEVRRGKSSQDEEEEALRARAAELKGSLEGGGGRPAMDGAFRFHRTRAARPDPRHLGSPVPSYPPRSLPTWCPQLYLRRFGLANFGGFPSPHTITHTARGFRGGCGRQGERREVCRERGKHGGGQPHLAPSRPVRNQIR